MITREQFERDLIDAKLKGTRIGITMACCLAAVIVALFAPVGCSAKKEIRTDLINVQQSAANCLSSWAVLGPRLEANDPNKKDVVNAFLFDHGEILQRLFNAAANYSASTTQKDLGDEAVKKLIDYKKAGERLAEVFNLQRRHFKAKDDSDLSAQVEAHSRNLYALAAAINKLSADLEPKKEQGK